MAISGKLAPDFADFYSACQAAVVSLKGFETGAGKVEGSLNKMANSLNGTKLIQDAVLMMKAVEAVGGASTLTANQMVGVNKTVTEAIAKYAALGQSAPKAMVDLAAATKAVEAPTASLSTRMVALGAFVGTMAANAVTALATLAINGVKALASGIGELVMSGGRVSAIQQSFDVLATSINTTGNAMLGSMRTGTRGLVGDLDLMQAANKAVLLGLPVTASEMGQLAATATTLGRAMGQGATKSFDDLITALGRSSPMILDNLGLSVKVGEANETYAKAIGKAADKLTEAEQKTAFYNAAMVAAREKVAALGESHNTLGDAIQRGSVWWENFKTDLGIAIARSPVLNAALTELGTAFAETFGASTSGRVATLTELVNTFALKLVGVASVGVSTAKYIAEGFYLMRGVLFGVFEAIADGVAMVARANATIVEIAASIPLIGGQWKAMAVDARIAADTVGSVAASFKTTKEEAFTSMGTAGAAFDSANDKLGRMRVAMVAAGAATTDTAQAVKELAGAEKAAAGPTNDLTAAAKRKAAALEELRVKGEGWQVTLGRMDQATITSIKNALALGAAHSTIATAFGVTAGQIDAVSASMQQATKSDEVFRTGLTFTSEVVGALAPKLAMVAAATRDLAAATAAGSLSGGRGGTSYDVPTTTVTASNRAGLEARMAAIEAGYRVNPGRAEGGTGTSGVSSWEGWAKVLDERIEYASLKAALANAPGFAGGVTNFRGGPAWVGERGPELLNLPRGSSITPHGAGAIAAGAFVFNLYGTPESLIVQVKAALARSVLQGVRVS